jgi:O-antigen/teichoic acid export membrane protein
MPVFTRLLAPSDYGIISVFTTIVGFFSIFFMMGVDSSMNLYYFEKEKVYDEFLGTNLIFIIVSGTVLSSLVLIFVKPLAAFLAVDSQIVIYALISCILAIPVTMITSYFQMTQNSRKYSIYNISKYTSITVLAIILIYLMEQNKYYGRLYAELAVSGILFIVLLPQLLKLTKFKFDIKYIKYTFIVGFPLIPHALTQIILNFSDRIIINMNSGENEVGLYAFAYNIGMVINTVIMGMNQSWAPIFYGKLRDEKYNDIINLSPKFIGIIFSIAILLIVFSRELVVLLGEKRYYSSFEIIPFVVMGYVFIFLYTVFANYAFYFKRNLRVSLFSMISAGVNIVLNIIFIPKYGYKFASVSTMIAFIVLFLIQYIDVRNYVNKQQLIPLRNFSYRFIFLLAGFIYFYLINQFSVNIIVELILNILVSGVLIFFIFNGNRKKLKTI